MSPFRAIAAGMRASVRNYPAAVWIYVVLTLASLPGAFAVFLLVEDYLGESRSAAEFARGLDPVLWAGLLRESPVALPVAGAAVLGGILVWLFLSTYLEGATISAVSRAEPPKTSDLFTSGGRVIGRLLRLFGIAAPFVILVAGGPGTGIYFAVRAICQDMVSEKGVLAVRVAGILLALVFLIWASGAHDFMRIEAVARGERRARYAFWRGLQRAARHPFSVLCFGSVFGGTGLAISVLASLLDVHLSRTSWGMMIAGLLLQQLVTFLRAMLRVGLAGAQVGYVMAETARR